MSQVIYRGPSINRVKRLGLMMSTVPPVNLATIYFKAPQLAELGSATQFVIGTLCCMEMTIPFLFYHYSKRYIYSVQVENKNEENEKFLIESLSPTMWGTKKTEFTSNDIRFPEVDQVSMSFYIKGQNGKEQKFLWDRAFVSDMDYYHMVRNASGTDYENINHAKLLSEEIETKIKQNADLVKQIEDMKKNQNL